MPNPEKAFVIIPAFNEEKSISGVIEAAQAADPFLINTEHILVVDNNSSDRTSKIAETMGAILISANEQGKGQAMDAGVDYVRKLGARVVTFLDGDLTGLKGSHIDLLAESVITGRTPMAVAIIDLWDNWLLPHIPWPSLSGERCMNVDIWDRLQPEDKKGFYIETAINAMAIEQGWFGQIEHVRLEGVDHDRRRKLKEQGLVQGSVEYTRVYSRAFRAYWRAYKARQTLIEEVNQ